MKRHAITVVLSFIGGVGSAENLPGIEGRHDVSGA